MYLSFAAKAAPTRMPAVRPTFDKDESISWTNEGLSRHDALHAIGFVLAEHVHDFFKSKDDAATSQARYNAAVERISAKSWRGG
jgi:hypothetical protein